MKFMLDDMEFVFPYDKMYPEQYNYVCDLKRSLDAHVSVQRSLRRCSLRALLSSRHWSYSSWNVR